MVSGEVAEEVEEEVEVEDDEEEVERLLAWRTSFLWREEALVILTYLSLVGW